MIKLKELKGYNSLLALNAFHKLMLGLKMLPSYCTFQYEEFYEMVDKLPDHEKEKLIREAVLFVELEKEEVNSMMGFVLDPNGVPYTSANINSLKPDQYFEGIVAVAKEISKIKINLISDDEKKN